MAKLSEIDKLVARIDADMAKRSDARAYAGKHGADGKVLDSIEADIADLKRIRDYITSEGATVAEGKPKRTRGKGKRAGLPATETGSNGE
jgi:hypothetical protein